jgi:hypothetical protein
MSVGELADHFRILKQIHLGVITISGVGLFEEGRKLKNSHSKPHVYFSSP